MGILNIQVFLNLCVGGFLGSIAGWAFQRWLHSDRTQAMKAAWRQDMSLLEERLSASAATVRAEQGRVAQYSNVLNSTRSALRQKEGMCAAAKADALALKAAIAECDAVLLARTQELAMERTDVQKARKQIFELKTALAAKEQRIAELEPLLSRPLDPKFLESQLPMSLGQNGQALPQTPREPGDDLKQIHGIGPVFEEMLKGIGIRYFRQIAAWTDQDVERIKSQLPGLKNRIVRDRWVQSAGHENEKKYGHNVHQMAS